MKSLSKVGVPQAPEKQDRTGFGWGLWGSGPPSQLSVSPWGGTPHQPTLSHPNQRVTSASPCHPGLARRDSVAPQLQGALGWHKRRGLGW